MSYGTTAVNCDEGDQLRSHHDSEDGATVDGYKERFFRYMNQEVDSKHADIVLLISYIITGLLDSSAVKTWGSFVSMQTGNTVYIGLGLSALHLADQSGNKRWIKSLTSLCFFALGAFCFSRYHHKFHEKRRWVLVVSFLIQLIFVLASALIVTFEVAGSDENKEKAELRWQVLMPIALVAFQSSAQAMISRALGFKSLTSVVLTSIYCDLFSDRDLFTLKWRGLEERNRRILAPLLLLFGAFCGGRWAQSETGLAGALLTAAAIKAFIAVLFMFWRREKPADDVTVTS